MLLWITNSVVFFFEISHSQGPPTMTKYRHTTRTHISQQQTKTFQLHNPADTTLSSTHITLTRVRFRSSQGLPRVHRETHTSAGPSAPSPISTSHSPGSGSALARVLARVQSGAHVSNQISSSGTLPTSTARSLSGPRVSCPAAALSDFPLTHATWSPHSKPPAVQCGSFGRGVVVVVCLLVIALLWVVSDGSVVVCVCFRHCVWKLACDCGVCEMNGHCPVPVLSASLLWRVLDHFRLLPLLSWYLNKNPLRELHHSLYNNIYLHFLASWPLHWFYWFFCNYFCSVLIHLLLKQTLFDFIFKTSTPSLKSINVTLAPSRTPPTWRFSLDFFRHYEIICMRDELNEIGLVVGGLWVEMGLWGRLWARKEGSRGGNRSY